MQSDLEAAKPEDLVDEVVSWCDTFFLFFVTMNQDAIYLIVNSRCSPV